jgi:hypothetical protein
MVNLVFIMVASAGENGPGMLETSDSKIGRAIIHDDRASLIPWPALSHTGPCGPCGGCPSG